MYIFVFLLYAFKISVTLNLILKVSFEYRGQSTVLGSTEVQRDKLCPLPLLFLSTILCESASRLPFSLSVPTILSSLSISFISNKLHTQTLCSVFVNHHCLNPLAIGPADYSHEDTPPSDAPFEHMEVILIQNSTDKGVWVTYSWGCTWKTGKNKTIIRLCELKEKGNGL